MGNRSSRLQPRLLRQERFALRGRIVTMNNERQVIDSGVVYVQDKMIIAVLPADAAPPAGFEAVPIVNTHGTIYPGMIELHNHLSYNILPLWETIPEKYPNREAWRAATMYLTQVQGPMSVLRSRSDFLQAIVRYVECKCLLGGVTTSQGVSLAKSNKIKSYYKGIVRNAEQGGSHDLPSSGTDVGDVKPKDAADFLGKLQRKKCYLLHLSEGADDTARGHFLALRIDPNSDKWAITSTLAGIHCAALHPEDFAVLAAHGGSMVWSPLSNLLLYGQTADIKAAKAAHVKMSLGSDWSPTGSKNLLGELKIARLVSANSGNGPVFSDQELVEMVTINPANMLKWQGLLGSVEAGKLADLLVLSGNTGDPYSALIDASEKDISLVVIDGVPRVGTTDLMGTFMLGTTEEWKVGGQDRLLYLEADSSGPVALTVKLKEATDLLKDGLHRLPELAKEPPQRGLEGQGAAQWSLVLDQDEFGGDIFSSPADKAAQRGLDQQARSISPDDLPKINLDPLTVADQPSFVNKLKAARNIPQSIKDAL